VPRVIRGIRCHIRGQMAMTSWSQAGSVKSLRRWKERLRDAVSWAEVDLMTGDETSQPRELACSRCAWHRVRALCFRPDAIAQTVAMVVIRQQPTVDTIKSRRVLSAHCRTCIFAPNSFSRAHLRSSTQWAPRRPTARWLLCLQTYPSGS
jgi:hypothetical protein